MGFVAITGKQKMIEPYDQMRDEIIAIKSEIDYRLCMVQYGKDIVDKMMAKFDVKIEKIKDKR